MSTKQNPGPYNCYANLLPDEPYFVLMGRDPSAPSLIEIWSQERYSQIAGGFRSASDVHKITAARQCAADMKGWRVANDGRWRLPTSVDLGLRPPSGIIDHCYRASVGFEEQFTTPRAVPESNPRKVSATVGAPPRPNLAPGMWVHYKFGVVYELMHLALNEGTGEWMVVHRNRQTMNVFVRPAREWTELVQGLDGRQVPRFREPGRDERTD